MSVQNRPRLVVMALALAGMMSASVSQASPGPILIVVPARQVAVKFAQDIAKLRSCFVVSYQKQPADRPPMLHVWDAQGSRWIEIDIGQYRAGTLFATAPSAVIFMGTDAELPSDLRTARSWTARELRLPTFNMGENVNQCDRLCNFSPHEWRWLSDRYELDLKDRNAKRRRYGRYGAPGQPPKGLAPPVEETEVEMTVIPTSSREQVSEVVEDVPIVSEPPRAAAAEIVAEPTTTEPENPVVAPPVWIPQKPSNVIDAGSK